MAAGGLFLQQQRNIGPFSAFIFPHKSYLQKHIWSVVAVADDKL